MFIDRVKVDLAAGKGGNGIVAWRREKYIPKGGPTGGNGGCGGQVVLQADAQIPSLEWFQHRRHLKAENGRQGGPNQQRGRNGKGLVLKVPCGTLVKDSKSGEILFDFTKDGEKWEICKGGRGGRGNHSFKSSTNRAPNTCTPGREGEACQVELELKLIADVGLVGFPNAGKSTLISALADVRVKIGAYPFTTLQPNLGYIEKYDYSRLFIADIPGIIENAHQNKGLGLEFLRHIERTKLLIFVLDASGIDGRTPADDFSVLRKEIAAYNSELSKRSYFVVLNKIDAEEAEENLSQFHSTHRIQSECLFELSALHGEGVSNLLDALKAESTPKN
ncbi:MAG: GTPase Obg [Chlamydiae bacterium]|nr:GTPase Obg [Chlamydiota bacterium]